MTEILNLSETSFDNYRSLVTGHQANQCIKPKQYSLKRKTLDLYIIPEFTYKNPHDYLKLHHWIKTYMGTNRNMKLIKYNNAFYCNEKNDKVLLDYT